MTVRAVLRNGEAVTLDPELGATAQEIVEGLTAETLTGSAVPLDMVELPSVDGSRTVAYADINAFEDWVPRRTGDALVVTDGEWVPWRFGRLMLEKHFQSWVIDLFTLHGWDVKHTPVPMRPVTGGKFVPDKRGKGTLDLKMTHTNPPRLVFAECKGPDGELTVEQVEEIRRLRAVVDEIRRLIDDQGDGVLTGDRCPVGVYVFQPGVEPLIEAIARGRVMVGA